MLCADRTVIPRKQRLPCLVHTLFVFFFVCFTAVFASSLLLLGASSIFGPRPAPPCSHTSFCMFSPATFHRITVLFSPAAISSCIPQTTVLFCYFSNSPFTFLLCILFHHATLGLRPCTHFCLNSSHSLSFIVPFRSQLLCTAPLTSFFHDVLDSNLSAVNGTDAPALLSVSFGV